MGLDLNLSVPLLRSANTLPVLQWLGIRLKWVWGHGFFSDRACHTESLMNPEKLPELLVGNNVAHLQRNEMMRLICPWGVCFILQRCRKTLTIENGNRTSQLGFQKNSCLVLL